MMKLRASTLIETIVAMVLLLLCFVISMMIYENVLDSENNRLKLSALLLMNNEAILTKKEKNYLDEEITFNDMKFKKTIYKYQNSEKLYVLTLTAYDKNHHKIIERNELIIMR